MWVSITLHSLRRVPAAAPARAALTAACACFGHSFCGEISILKNSSRERMQLGPLQPLGQKDASQYDHHRGRRWDRCFSRSSLAKTPNALLDVQKGAKRRFLNLCRCKGFRMDFLLKHQKVGRGGLTSWVL